MARLLCMALLSLLALCRGDPAERQRSAPPGLDNVDPEDDVGLLQQKLPDAEDHVALLQHVLEPHRRQTKKGMLMRQLPPGSEIDCAVYNDLCKPPFDCHLANATSNGIKSDTFGYAYDGKPDLQQWCRLPMYMPYASKCMAGELVEAAQIHFVLTEAGIYGEHTREFDGSYCFIEGLCVNMAVTENTTLEEASRLCDARFGREAWTRWGAKRMPEEDRLGYGLDLFADPGNGFSSPKQTRPYLLAACAMGNFHCDVMYCRETYCKSDYYVEKYGHYLKEFGWVP